MNFVWLICVMIIMTDTTDTKSASAVPSRSKFLTDAGILADKRRKEKYEENMKLLVEKYGKRIREGIIDRSAEGRRELRVQLIDFSFHSELPIVDDMMKHIIASHEDFVGLDYAVSMMNQAIFITW